MGGTWTKESLAPINMGVDYPTTTNSVEAWKTALEYLAPYGHTGNALGDWRSHHHQIM
jgi:hypothetical protein